MKTRSWLVSLGILPLLSVFIFASWVTSWLATRVPLAWHLALLLFFLPDLPRWMIPISLAWLAPGAWLTYYERCTRLDPDLADMRNQVVAARNAYGFWMIGWIVAQLAWFGFAWNLVSFPGGTLVFLVFPATAFHLLALRTSDAWRFSLLSLAFSLVGAGLLGYREARTFLDRVPPADWILVFGAILGVVGLSLASLTYFMSIRRMSASGTGG